MNKNLNPIAGNVNRGNWNRMKQVMNRAKEGEPIKIHNTRMSGNGT